MTKAKRLLAAVLVVIMAVSMMTFSAFAAGEKVFADDYVAINVPEGSAAPTKNAVIITTAARGKDKNTEISVKWDDQNWIFTVGKNAFDPADFKKAETQADILANGGMPQILLAAGTYQDLDISQSMQVFGYHWKDNPNVVGSDPTKPWTLNSKWNSDVTIVHDVTILASAVGTIDIYGIQIAHRFYDCWRGISAIKTKLTLRNVHLYQTDKTTALKTNSATGRTTIMEKYAMTFWNPNSHNSAATAKNNKDETYLINFRVGKLDMVAGDNRIIDEKVSPVFVIDGFCADYANSSNAKTQTFWMKWSDGFSRTRCEVKNSYFTAWAGAVKSSSFDYEGFYSNKDTDVEAGEWAEIIFDNNIFYNNNTASDSQTWVYQSEYDKVTFTNNLFMNSAGGQFIRWQTTAGGNLSDAIVMTDNTWVGYSSVSMTMGSDGTEIDMTGTHIQPTYSTDYKSMRSSVLPTGNVKYDYCYLDGARTISTASVQSFTVKDAIVNENDKTISLTSEKGFYYKTPVVEGLVEWELYESDAGFSNADDFSNSTLLERCTLKDTTNYFLFVVYSLDKSNYVVYKMTVTRPAPDGLEVAYIESDKDFTISGANIVSDLSKDDESVTFKPVVDAGVTYKLNYNGKTYAMNDDGTYTVDNLVRGVEHQFRLEIKKDADAEYYTLKIVRPFNTACELISVSDNVVNTARGEYTANLSSNDKDLVFEVEVSEDAWAYVKDGTTVYTAKNGIITVPNVKLDEYEFGVVAEDGITANVYKLNVGKVKSNKAELISIAGATAGDNGYTASAVSSFKVDAAVSAGATYTVYADANLSTPVADNAVAVADEPVTVYVVVTAEDGVTTSAPVAVTVTKMNVKFEVVDAVNNEGGYVVEVEKDAKSYELKFVTENCTYELFADNKLTVPASATVNFDSAAVTLYAKVSYPDNTSEAFSVTAVSERTATAYTDAAKIPGWAKVYVDALNATGYGFIRGDEKGNFNAANGMTRYEIAAIATRLLGVDASQFKNVKLEYADNIAPWAENYVKAVTALGIMTGSKNAAGKLEFNGQGTTTRAQLAKIIVDVNFIANGSAVTSLEYYNANKEVVDAAYEKFAFADDAKVANWAKPYVRLAVYAEYFRGSVVNGKNYINANDNILRQEIAVVICEYAGITK